MARFLSAIQKEVAGLGSKINEDMTIKFAQQEAALLHKAKPTRYFFQYLDECRILSTFC